MKRIVAAMLALAMLLPLTACGSKSYEVTTKTGRTFNTQGSPKYDMKSETYTFTDEEGKEVIVNQSDVDIIRESGK